MKSVFGHGSLRAGWRLSARSVATLLLAVISFDLTADARCDPVSRMAREHAAQAGPQSEDVGREACAPSCLPDCYCCSSSLGAVVVSVPQGSTEVVVLPPDRAGTRPAGVRPVPYHPPPLAS